MLLIDCVTCVYMYLYGSVKLLICLCFLSFNFRCWIGLVSHEWSWFKFVIFNVHFSSLYCGLRTVNSPARNFLYIHGRNMLLD